MKYTKPDDHEKQLELYLSGYNDSQIAKSVAKTQKAIQMWRKRNGLQAIIQYQHSSKCYTCARGYATLCGYIRNGDKVYDEMDRGIVTECSRYLDDSEYRLPRKMEFSGEVSYYRIPTWGRVHLN